MAVAVDVTGAESYSNGVGPINVALTTGSSLTNGAMFFIAILQVQTLPGVTCTWDLVPMTLVASGNAPGGTGRVELWGLSPIGAHTGLKNLAYSWTGGATCEAMCVAISLTGVDQTGGTTSFPNGASAPASSGTGGFTSSVTVASNVNDMVFAGFVNEQHGWTSANNTQILLDNGGTNINGLMNRAAGAGSVTMSGIAPAGSADGYVAVGVDVLAFGAVTPPSGAGSGSGGGPGIILSTRMVGI